MTAAAPRAGREEKEAAAPPLIPGGAARRHPPGKTGVRVSRSEAKITRNRYEEASTVSGEPRPESETWEARRDPP